MIPILSGTIIISILHALIPSHWLPLITLAKTQQWSRRETIRISLYLVFAHVLSTSMLGIVLAVFLEQISYLDHWNWLGPVLLVITGMYFIYRHHTHHHFHIDDQMMEQTKTRRQIIYALMAFMFLSPCLEVLAYFINAGMHSWWFLAICIMIYILFSLAGTLIWVYYAYQGIQKINSHAWEHNAGLIMGTIMIITGIVSWLL